MKKKNPFLFSNFFLPLHHQLYSNAGSNVSNQVEFHQLVNKEHDNSMTDSGTTIYSSMWCIFVFILHYEHIFFTNLGQAPPLVLVRNSLVYIYVSWVQNQNCISWICKINQWYFCAAWDIGITLYKWHTAQKYQLLSRGKERRKILQSANPWGNCLLQKQKQGNLVWVIDQCCLWICIWRAKHLESVESILPSRQTSPKSVPEFPG